MTEGAVGSLVVVVVDPGLECTQAVAAGRIAGGVGPFVQKRLDEAFGFAVGAGPVGLGEDVADAQLSAERSDDTGAVVRAVVAHDAAVFEVTCPS